MESSIQCMFFGKVYEAAAADLAIDTVVRIRGMVEVRDESVSLRATEMDVPTLEAVDERRSSSRCRRRRSTAPMSCSWARS